MELEELIQSVNIVDYISQFVDLEEKNGEYWGLSCFKDENTPSFSVREDPPVFYDYSSGIGGNVFTFIKHYNKCSSSEAVEILKSFAGFDGEMQAPRQKMSATMTCKKFAMPKKHHKQSISTILSKDYMDRYEKRPDKLAEWEKEGISKASLDRFQVRYDGFSDRLVYPIRNINGDIVNIGGRTLDPAWKEKNLRKYTYFHPWGAMETIYGLFENLKYILEKKEVILFEGCKSVLIADTWGIKNGAAILTSHLNPAQMKILAKLGCRVVFALDKDVRVTDDHNIKILKNYIDVDYLWDKSDLLDDKDAPVDKGLEVFKQLYDERLRYK